MRILRSHKLTLLAAGILLGYIVLALGGPWLAPHDPYKLSEHPVAAPSVAHPLGTDQLGRDILSRIIHGARVSLQVALLAVGLALAAGTVLGILAGYFRGLLDGAVSRLTDIMFALPEVLLALVIMAILGQGVTNITLAIGIVYTPIFTRVARGQTLSVTQRPYVEAARAVGASHGRILTRHVLPNIAGPLIVQATLCFAFAILAEAALSFLGLGGEPDAPTWGNMLRTGKDWMEQAWWIAVFPGLAITLAVFSFNILGDRLRDTLDPR